MTPCGTSRSWPDAPWIPAPCPAFLISILDPNVNLCSVLIYFIRQVWFKTCLQNSRLCSFQFFIKWRRPCCYLHLRCSAVGCSFNGHVVKVICFGHCFACGVWIENFPIPGLVIHHDPKKIEIIYCDNLQHMVKKKKATTMYQFI